MTSSPLPIKAISHGNAVQLDAGHPEPDTNIWLLVQEGAVYVLRPAPAFL